MTMPPVLVLIDRAVNALIGGSLSSAHMRGLAADFIAPKYGRPKAIAEAVADHARQRN